MKKRLSVIFLFAAVLSFVLTACGDDGPKESYAPVYGKMLFNPSPAIIGDSVTVTVEQLQKGYGLEKTTYSWSFRYYIQTEDGQQKDTTEVHSSRTNYDGRDNGDPSIRFYVPDNCVGGNINVTLQAEFSGYVGNALFLQASKNGTLSIQ